MADGWEVVARLEDLPAEGGQMVEIAGKRIAVFRQGTEVYATDDSCPHAGAPLSEGYLSAGIVTCPWHAWRFCISDGHWADVPGSKTRLTCYPARATASGEVEVQIPADNR